MGGAGRTGAAGVPTRIFGTVGAGGAWPQPRIRTNSGSARRDIQRGPQGSSRTSSVGVRIPTSTMIVPEMMTVCVMAVRANGARSGCRIHSIPVACEGAQKAEIVPAAGTGSGGPAQTPLDRRWKVHRLRSAGKPQSHSRRGRTPGGIRGPRAPLRTRVLHAGNSPINSPIGGEPRAAGVGQRQLDSPPLEEPELAEPGADPPQRPDPRRPELPAVRLREAQRLPLRLRQHA